jgi:hypothetical protein
MCSAHYSLLQQAPFDSISKVKVKESRNRPGVAQRATGGLGPQLFVTFGT